MQIVVKRNIQNDYDLNFVHELSEHLLKMFVYSESEAFKLNEVLGKLRLID